jgi:hypothetical protein
MNQMVPYYWFHNFSYYGSQAYWSVISSTWSATFLVYWRDISNFPGSGKTPLTEWLMKDDTQVDQMTSAFSFRTLGWIKNFTVSISKAPFWFFVLFSLYAFLLILMLYTSLHVMVASHVFSATCAFIPPIYLRESNFCASSASCLLAFTFARCGTISSFFWCPLLASFFF